jgi:uncharacterized Zn finger protein
MKGEIKLDKWEKELEKEETELKNNLDSQLDSLIAKHDKKKMISILQMAYQKTIAKNTDQARKEFQSFYSLFAFVLERKNIIEEEDLYLELQKIHAEIGGK